MKEHLSNLIFEIIEQYLTLIYWVTKNKVHCLLVISYLIFKVNSTQESYVIHKWSFIQWSTIFKMSFKEKYLKLHENLENCTLWNIFQDFSVINLFISIKGVRKVFMFDNCIKYGEKNLKSAKNISNRPATAIFYIFL